MRALRDAATAALVFVLLAFVCDRLFVATLRPSERLSDNFSRAFLAYEIGTLRSAPGETVFLGDSVLWGYRIPAAKTAVADLRRHGVAAIDLAYEGGSPVNTYAMLQALLAAGVRPARVVFNVNQKVFNANDSAYATVHPSVLPLARARISAPDLALLAPRTHERTFEAAVDAAVGRHWQLYAMRSDVREMLFGDIDAAHALAALIRRFTGAAGRADAAHRPAAEAFEGTYDLTPLDERNTSVHFLERTADLLARYRVPAIALLTPTNHALLHEYIDAPEYDRNLAYVSRLLARRGVRVLDLDRAFDAAEFIDNDHLTAAANARLAKLLARDMPT